MAAVIAATIDLVATDLVKFIVPAGSPLIGSGTYQLIVYTTGSYDASNANGYYGANHNGALSPAPITFSEGINAITWSANVPVWSGVTPSFASGAPITGNFGIGFIDLNNGGFPFLTNIVNLSGGALCLTENTRVLTPMGYVRVKELNKYDYVSTADGRNVLIKHIHHSHNFNVGEMEAPFFVPANALGNGVPLNDIKLSPDHLVHIGGDRWMSPRHMAARSDKVVQQDIGENVHYYNIMTPNYFYDNLVIEDGVVVEGYGYRRIFYDGKADAYQRMPEQE